MITEVAFNQKVATFSPTNHVFVVDVSGSMYQALTKIRQHLKNNLASLVKPDDTVSILYFSGKGQFGNVFVGKQVNNLSDLNEIQTTIDRFLMPICLTGFVEPLQQAIIVADQLPKDKMNNLIFLTDGYDNCWEESEILDVCSKLPMYYSNISFIEYGWYCNRPLLEKMAAAVDGMHSFVESYDMFEPTFDLAITQDIAMSVQVEVGKAEHALYIKDQQVFVVSAVDGKALVPETATTVYAVGKETVSMLENVTSEPMQYALLYYAVHTMNSELAWAVLKETGDIRLIKAYENCFTKQDYTNMKELARECVVDAYQRGIHGIDYDMVPNETATTIIDVLECLVANGAYLNLEALDYSRTGRKAIQTEDGEWKPYFHANAKTVSMSNLVYNSNRPNISIQTNVPGTIGIPDNIQFNYNLPGEVETKIFRNYTVVKDGIINIKRLPVIIKTEALHDLEVLGVDFEYEESEGSLAYITVLLHNVPLINRSMVKTVSGVDLARKAVALQFLKAKQKVFKHYRDELVGKVNSVGLAQLYGPEAAKFLSENGIRDYGFSPKTTLAESQDFYMSKELNLKIKSLSSLPSVSAVLKKLESGKKLTLGEEVINFAIDEYKTIMIQPNVLEVLQKRAAETIGFVRELERDIAKIGYSIVIGKAWFPDLDDNDKALVRHNSMSFEVTPVLEEKKVKI